MSKDHLYSVDDFLNDIRRKAKKLNSQQFSDISSALPADITSAGLSATSEKIQNEFPNVGIATKDYGTLGLLTINVDFDNLGTQYNIIKINDDVNFAFNNLPREKPHFFVLDLEIVAVGDPVVSFPATVQNPPTGLPTANGSRYLLYCVGYLDSTGTKIYVIGGSLDGGGGGGDFANKFLSNLTSPTAINQHLLPSADNTRNFGSASLRWLNGFFANTVRAAGFEFGAATRIMFGTTALGIVTDVPLGESIIFREDGNTYATFNDVLIDFSNSFFVDVPSLSVKYEITLDDGLINPIINGEIKRKGDDILIFSGGAVRNLSDIANRTLSNLLSPTSINQDLTPNIDNVFNLGYFSPSKAWATVATKRLVIPSGGILNGSFFNLTTSGSHGRIGLPLGGELKFYWNGFEFGKIFQETLDFTLFELLIEDIIMSKSLVFNDSFSDPIVNGQIKRVGNDIKVKVNDIVVSLSDAAIGANKTLSNLLDPIAINQNLIPATVGTKTLGDATKYFSTANLTAIILRSIGSISNTFPSMAPNSGLDWIFNIPASKNFLFYSNGVEIARLNSSLADFSILGSVGIKNAIINLGVFFNDSLVDPTAAGEMRRNGADVKVFSGGAVRNLSLVANEFPLSQNADFNTFRGINAGDPIDPQDLVTQNALDLAFSSLWEALGLWDIGNAAFLQTLTLTIEGATTPRTLALYFRADGKKFYISLTSTVVIIQQYDLSTPWNISTAVRVGSYDATFSPPDPTSGAGGLFFKPDGTRMYIARREGATNVFLEEYSLSTPWDITTVDYIGGTNIPSVNVGNITGGLYMRYDGKKFWMGSPSQNLVYEISMSTPWDRTTMSNVQNSGVTDIVDLHFRPDGRKLFVMNALNDRVDQYALGSPWNIAVLTFEKSFSVAAQETIPDGIWIGKGGSKLYHGAGDEFGAGSNKLHEYNLI